MDAVSSLVLDDNPLHFAGNVPDAITDQDDAQEPGESSNADRPNIVSLIWGEHCPQPEPTVTKNSEEQEDEVEVL